MTITDKIQHSVQKLPIFYQEEVLNFVEYLLTKTRHDTLEQQEQQERQWYESSMALAMRGMEDEDTPLYTDADIKETCCHHVSS